MGKGFRPARNLVRELKSLKFTAVFSTERNSGDPIYGDYVIGERVGVLVGPSAATSVRAF